MRQFWKEYIEAIQVCRNVVIEHELDEIDLVELMYTLNFICKPNCQHRKQRCQGVHSRLSNAIQQQAHKFVIQIN
jgi:hypothetical protein